MWQKILKFWFPVICYSAMIFGVSSLPMGKSAPPFPAADKVIHIAEYSGFGYLLARGFMNSFPTWPLAKVSVLAVGTGVAYGISDEFHQSFVPSRESSIYDVFADTIGTVLGNIVYFGFYRRRKNPEMDRNR